MCTRVYLPRFHRCQRFGKEHSSGIPAFLALHLGRSLGDPQSGSFQILKSFKSEAESLLLSDQGSLKPHPETPALHGTGWQHSPKLGTMGAASV